MDKDLKRVICDYIKYAAVITQQGVNHLLWPAICINCRKSICETDNHLCRDCWDDLLICTGDDYCRRCGLDTGKYGIISGSCPDCQGKEILFDGIARAGIYQHVLRKMILSFKNGRTELDSVLGFLVNSALQGSDFLNEVEVLIPVPLHWSKRLTRGYNQSQVLIKKIKHDTATISTDLVRIRRTRSQPTMTSPSARKKNVAGAFAVRYRHKLDECKVCLVDDIKTTGATLNECAKTLKNAGASKVYALVLAVAGQKDRG